MMILKNCGVKKMPLIRFLMDLCRVVDHAKSYEKKEVFEPLQPSFQRFLQSRHDVIHLANEVFSVFAPKMNLKMVYTELMVSGGIHKGWTVYNADVFAQPIDLLRKLHFR